MRRLDPNPADLAYASLEPLPWSIGPAGVRAFYSTKIQPSCSALPCLDWARGAAPSAIVSLPPKQSHIRREELLQRQAWVRYCSWSRITNGVLLSVTGAVQYGTAKIAGQGNQQPAEDQKVLRLGVVKVYLKRVEHLVYLVGICVESHMCHYPECFGMLVTSSIHRSVSFADVFIWCISSKRPPPSFLS
jgi:hypothetical protein